MRNVTSDKVEYEVLRAITDAGGAVAGEYLALRRLRTGLSLAGDREVVEATLKHLDGAVNELVRAHSDIYEMIRGGE